jgi:hypothetical protein
MQLRRTLSDAARLNDQDCFAIVERYKGFEVTGTVGVAGGRVDVFRSRYHRTKLARMLERSIEMIASGRLCSLIPGLGVKFSMIILAGPLFSPR